MIDKEVFATSVNDTVLGGLGARQKGGKKGKEKKRFLTNFYTRQIRRNMHSFFHASQSGLCYPVYTASYCVCADGGDFHRHCILRSL